MDEYDTGRFTHADASGVRSRTDFVQFLGEVLNDLRGSGQREWENATLERFLDAFAAVADSFDERQGVHGTASWRDFAQLVAGATGYE